MVVRGSRMFGAALAAMVLVLVAVATAVTNGPPPSRPLSPPGSLSPAGTSFTFAAVGDLGAPGNADMVALSKRVKAMDASFLLAMGDLGYTTDEPGWCSSIKSGINDVLLIAGNHDTGESSGGDIGEFVKHCPFTLDVPVVAGPGTPGYGYEYYFDYPNGTPLMRFILTTAGVRGSTNYDYRPGTSHYNFVVNAVNDARSKGIPWVMVGGHKPCINAHSYGCEFGQGLFDKMVELKVDLLLFAHTHTYQRSHQLGLSDACPTVPSNGNFDADCIVDHGDDDHYEQGPGSVVVINGVGGQSFYDIGFGTDLELGYMVHVMGNNGNSKGLLKGHGAVAFTVSESGFSEVTDFCPPGSTGSDGQCPGDKDSAFWDAFTIGAAASPPPPPPSGIPAHIALTSSPNPSDIGQPVLVSGKLTNQSSGVGIAGQTVLLEWSWDNVTWSPESQIGQFTTGPDGRYEGTMAFGAPGQANHTEYMRTRFDATGPYDGSTSRVVAHDVRNGSVPPATRPTARFTYSPPSPQVGDTVSVDASTSTSDPGTTIQARWDWEADGVWDTAFSSSLIAAHGYGAPGTYTLSLEVRDSNGLSDTTSQMVSVSELDTVAPVTAHSISGAVGTDGWFLSGVGVALSATDDSSGVAAIHARIDGGAWQIYANPLSVLGDGIHVIDYSATDVAGNVEDTRTLLVRIDTAAPTTTAEVTGTLVPDGSYVSQATVALTSVDALSGVATMQYRIDGGAWWNYSGPFSVSGDGSRTIDYAAMDAAGNLEPPKGAVIRITGSGGIAPTTTAEVTGTIGLNGWYVTPVTVALRATSPNGAATTIAYTIGGITWKTYEGPFTVPEGRHTVAWQASDEAGYSESPNSMQTNVDLTDPYVLDLKPSGVLAGPEAVVDWTGFDWASGIMGYEVSVDGAASEWLGLTMQIVRRWPIGPHHIEVRAIDHAGRMSPIVSTDFEVQAGDAPFPVALQRSPFFLPAIGLALLALSYLFVLRRRLGERGITRASGRSGHGSRRPRGRRSKGG